MRRHAGVGVPGALRHAGIALLVHALLLALVAEGEHLEVLRLVELLADQTLAGRCLQPWFDLRRRIEGAPLDLTLLLERQPHDIRSLALLDLFLSFSRRREDLVVQEVQIELLLNLGSEIGSLLFDLLEILHLLPVIAWLHRREQDFLGVGSRRLDEFRSFGCRWVGYCCCFFRMLFHFTVLKLKF